jgi:hypothetical protein
MICKGMPHARFICTSVLVLLLPHLKKPRRLVDSNA